jgi:hypothetical protein
MNPKSSAARVNVSLAAADNVVSDIASVPGYATFPDATQGFALNFEDQNLQRAFGGDISVAAQSLGTDIAVTIKRETGTPPCADVRPDVAVRTNFHRVVRIAAANPQLVSRAIQDLRPFAARLPTDASPQADDIASSYPSLSPLVDQHDLMVRSLSTEDVNRISNLRYAADVGGSSSSATTVQMLMLMDIHLCHTQLVNAGMPGPEGFYPELNLSGENPAAAVEFRDKQAGRYLLCRFGYDQIPDNLKAVLRQESERLGR